MKYLTLLALVLPLSTFANAVRNGGNSIYCNKSSQFDEGLNNLDYAILVSQGLKRENLVPVKNLENSISRIQGIINSLPIKNSIKKEFDSHRSGYLKALQAVKIEKPESSVCQQTSSVKSCWIPVKMDSIEVDDKGDLSMISSNCFDIYGAIARTATSGQITYLYSPLNLAKMISYPLQLSFLAIHEFLWFFTDNIEVNRRVNWLLHSKAIDKLTPSEILIALKSLGINVEKFESNNSSTCVDFSGTFDIEESSGLPWLEERQQFGCTHSNITGIVKETGYRLGPFKSIYDGILRPSSGIVGERNMTMWRGKSLVTIAIFESPQKMDIYWIKEDLQPDGNILQYRRYVDDSGFTFERTDIIKRVEQ